MIVKQLKETSKLLPNKKCLICAHSNRAVSQAFHQLQSNFTSDEILSTTSDLRDLNTDFDRRVDEKCLRDQDYIKCTNELKITERDTVEERDKRRQLTAEIKNITMRYGREILGAASIVFSTLSSTARKEFFDYVACSGICFEYVMIDEACQATEISCLAPLKLGCKKLVLIGDPKQLPATVISNQAKNGLQQSLFERLALCKNVPKVMLSVEYRMTKGIYPIFFLFLGLYG
jgi:senataxin